MKKNVLILVLLILVGTLKSFASTEATRQYNFVNDKANSIPITASRMDAEFDAIITKLNQKAVIKSSAPSGPIEGMLWYDSTNKVFKVYRNSTWIQILDAANDQTITGTKTFSLPIVSTLASGTAPFTVASTTKVTNLNADTLDGYDTSATAVASKIPITNGSGLLTPFITKAALGIDSGTLSAAGNVSTSVNFAFSFGSAPIVVACYANDRGASNVGAVGVHTITTTGFQVSNTDDDATPVNWIAVGALP